MKALKYVLVWLLIFAIVAALALPVLAAGESRLGAYQPDKDVNIQANEGIGDTGSLGRQPLLTPEQQKIVLAVAGCAAASAVIVVLLIKKGKK